MKLGVNELRDQLKLRRWATSGTKQALQACLREAIEQNLPVSTTAAPPQHECMNGLDVMARWVLLTCNTTPIPEPVNIDASLCLPTERDGTLNPKYGFQEKCECIPFSGTTAKMTYLKTKEEVAAYNKSQKQKHSMSRQNRAGPSSPR